MFARLALVLLITAGLAAPVTAMDPQELLAKVDRNLNPESFESLRKLINIEPDGTSKEFVLFTAKKGIDKLVGLFLAPASDKGRSTLRPRGRQAAAHHQHAVGDRRHLQQRRHPGP